MPGNEFGERIHNFFGQENISQGQHQSQVVDGAWPGFSNGLLVGNQRQIGSALIPNFKNYIAQQTVDSERGQSSSAQHGLNFTEPGIRPEFSRNQSENHQPTINGFMHGNQVFQTMQNEANFLGVDTESDRRRLTSKGIPPDLHRNSMRLETGESPVNYDFFGGQQQINSQFPVMLQSLPRQQAGISDTQLVQQKLMLKQMQELQRQQQLQKQQFAQLEARQASSLNQVAFSGKQMSDSHSQALINGVPVHDTSNNSWQTELMPTNMNWLQRGMSPVVQGSSSGHMLFPEQGGVHLMGSAPQQFEQSLYGVPVSSSRGIPNTFSSVQMDKMGMQHTLPNNNPFPGNQYAAFSNQGSMQDIALLSRPGYQEKFMLSHAPNEGSNNGIDFENLRQVDPIQRDNSGQEFGGRQEVVGPSEKAHQKTPANVSTAHTAATLDPTEEKILFGSDDNLWDSFGHGTNMNSGGNNTFGGSDIFAAFPSVQSGSWSALMQSAVAETSTGDTGLQGWNSIGVRHSEPACASQPPSTVHDGGKQQAAWADSNMRTGFMVNSRPFPLFNNSNPGAQQQINTSQTMVQQFPQEGSRSLDHSLLQKPVAEHNQMVGNISRPPNADVNTESLSCSNQQNVSSYNAAALRGNLPRGWNISGAASPIEGVNSKVHGNDTAFQNSSDDDVRSAIREGMASKLGIWKAAVNSNSAGPLERKNSSTNALQTNRVTSEFTTATAVNDSSTLKDYQGNRQQHPNIHNKNSVENTNSYLNSMGSGLPGVCHPDEGSQILESSAIDRLRKGALTTHEMGNSEKENSSDSFRSNLSPQTSAGGFRDSNQLNANDPHTLPGGKQKPSGRRPSVTRKFQYHPMGNIDVEEESSHREKAMHSQFMSQQAPERNQDYLGPSKSLGQMARNYMQIEQGHLFQGDSERTHEAPKKGVYPDSAPAVSASFEKTFDNCQGMKATSSSQNMLELLHKVDQSREHYGVHLSSSDKNQSYGIPEGKTSDGSGGQLQNSHPSASQGFNLQLGPPSQRLLSSDSSNSHHVASDVVGGKCRSGLVPWASNQPLPHRETFPRAYNAPSNSGQVSNNASQYNVQGDSSAFTSGFSHSKGYPQNQHMTVAGVTASQPFNSSLERFPSQPKQRDESGERAQSSESARGFPVLEAMPASQPSVTSGTSQQGPFPKMISNPWASIAAEQRQFGSQPSMPHADRLKSHLQYNNSSEGSFSGQQKTDQISQSRGHMSPEVGAPLANLQPEKEQSAKKQPSLLDHVAGQKTMAVPSLRGQESAAGYPSDAAPLVPRAVEDDPANRSVKRVKGPDSIVDPQEAASQGERQSTSGSDKKTSGPDMLPFGQNVSQSVSDGNLIASIGADHQQISPQMAPSWFNQFGTFKNGQVLATYDARRSVPSKVTEQNLVIERPSDGSNSSQALKHVNADDTSQHGNIPQTSSTMSKAPESLSSPQSFPHAMSDQSLAVAAPNKRKAAIVEPLSWSKEVVQGSKRLQTISEAEMEWARATNRLAEKVEDEAELVEDVPPVLRSKRRLVLTTQLMQQLLRPPAPAVSSSDANSNYESTAYIAARAALGDACGTVSCNRSDSLVSCGNANILSKRPGTLERIGDQYMSKAMEDFISRAKKLENDLQRLERGALVSDIRQELQELERYAVINRFAKFHTRGQADGVETSSFPDASTSPLKSYPQRYVIAIPMPRNVPDGVQCLSL